jgi:hypothetical protein
LIFVAGLRSSVREPIWVRKLGVGELGKKIGRLRHVPADLADTKAHDDGMDKIGRANTMKPAKMGSVLSLLVTPSCAADDGYSTVVVVHSKAA